MQGEPLSPRATSSFSNAGQFSLPACPQYCEIVQVGDKLGDPTAARTPQRDNRGGPGSGVIDAG